MFVCCTLEFNGCTYVSLLTGQPLLYSQVTAYLGLLLICKYKMHLLREILLNFKNIFFYENTVFYLLITYYICTNIIGFKKTIHYILVW